MPTGHFESQLSREWAQRSKSDDKQIKAMLIQDAWMVPEHAFFEHMEFMAPLSCLLGLGFIKRARLGLHPWKRRATHDIRSYGRSIYQPHNHLLLALLF
jgi:hypothetical protein